MTRIPSVCRAWRGGRAVECAGLENHSGSGRQLAIEPVGMLRVLDGRRGFAFVKAELSPTANGRYRPSEPDLRPAWCRACGRLARLHEPSC